MFKVLPGIEPGLKDSKSLVIPLHHKTKWLVIIKDPSKPSFNYLKPPAATVI